MVTSHEFFRTRFLPSRLIRNVIIHASCCFSQILLQIVYGIALCALRPVSTTVAEILRALRLSIGQTPATGCGCTVGQFQIGRRWVDKLAQLEVEVSQDTADSNGAGKVRKAVSPRWRKPTPLQTARWRAVRKAKRKGLSIRGIARELGIHRNTVKRYMNAESPPMSRGRAKSTVS